MLILIGKNSNDSKEDKILKVLSPEKSNISVHIQRSPLKII